MATCFTSPSFFSVLTLNRRRLLSLHITTGAAAYVIDPAKTIRLASFLTDLFVLALTYSCILSCSRVAWRSFFLLKFRTRKLGLFSRGQDLYRRRQVPRRHNLSSKKQKETRNPACSSPWQHKHFISVLFFSQCELFKA